MTVASATTNEVSIIPNKPQARCPTTYLTNVNAHSQDLVPTMS
jgi:hypothetical protein